MKMIPEDKFLEFLSYKVDGMKGRKDTEDPSKSTFMYSFLSDHLVTFLSKYAVELESVINLGDLARFASDKNSILLRLKGAKDESD